MRLPKISALSFTFQMFNFTLSKKMMWSHFLGTSFGNALVMISSPTEMVKVSGLIEDSWILMSAATSVCLKMLFGLKYMKKIQPYSDVQWKQRAMVSSKLGLLQWSISRFMALQQLGSELKSRSPVVTEGYEDDWGLVDPFRPCYTQCHAVMVMPLGDPNVGKEDLNPYVEMRPIPQQRMIESPRVSSFHENPP
ncbi:hypothetical protein H671_2g5071 [Cricetulus griseus]|nr:hypothetical protein H671_2g5071 [Cricetulus griseus]